MELGVNGIKHYATGDEKSPTCPMCYSNNNVVLDGYVSVDKVEQEVHKCTHCNILFSSEDRRGAVEGLIREAQEKGAENVSYKSVVVSAFDDPHNNHSIPGLNEYDVENAVRRANEQVVQSLTEVTNSMNRVVDAIQSLGVENRNLVEELLKDPMINIRKAVNQFNLE